MLDEREAFLRTIFSDPTNDLPRLVYADWLDENRSPELAGLIRVQCEIAARPAGEVTPELLAREAEWLRLQPPSETSDPILRPVRGFLEQPMIVLGADDLRDRDSLRMRAVVEHPEWYGATKLTISQGKITTPFAIETIFEMSAFANVVDLNLDGDLEFLSPSEITFSDFRYEPRISLPILEVLFQHRWARRLTKLSLENNDLDNDALRAIVRSPNLLRIEQLEIFQGNRFRGATWQQLIERFGEKVMS